MSEKWEIRRVSTSERIFHKITEEMEHPVGIVLFGADSLFKSVIHGKIWDAFLHSNSYHYPGLPSTDLLETSMRHDSIVVIMLDAEPSSMAELRRELIATMRNVGAKTIVGIYAKPKPYPLKTLIRLPRVREFNKQITTIERSNPSADGLDYFIVAEEE